MDYSIREAGLSDIQTIRDIADIAFRATYASIISPGQIDFMLDWMYSEETLAREMSSGVNYLLLVCDGKAVAYVSFGPDDKAQSGLSSGVLYHLHKIYILPEFQSRGFGRVLFAAAEACMRKRGAIAFELNVNRSNPALGFYERMGMHISRSGDFYIGNGFFMNDYIMRKELG